MNPRFSIDNSSELSFTNTKHSGKFRSKSWLEEISYFFHIVFRKNSVPIFRPFLKTSFSHCIVNVLFIVTKPKMLWINARRVVARMTDIHSIWNFPLVDFVRNSMGSSSTKKFPVTIFVFAPKVYPACGSFFNFKEQKSFLVIETRSAESLHVFMRIWLSAVKAFIGKILKHWKISPFSVMPRTVCAVAGLFMCTWIIPSIVKADVTTGTVLVIDKIAPKNGAFTGLVNAENVDISTNAFGGNLGTGDVDLQTALETIDNLSIGGGSGGGFWIGTATSALNMNGYAIYGSSIIVTTGTIVAGTGANTITTAAGLLDTTKLATKVSLSTGVTGSLPDGNLSANVPLLNSTQTFTGTNNFTGEVNISSAVTIAGSTITYTDMHVVVVGTLTVNGVDVSGGAGAGTIEEITVTDPVVGGGTSGTVNIGLNAISLSTGVTGTLADGSLSANVALLNSSQTFTGALTLAGAVIISSGVTQALSTSTLNDVNVILAGTSRFIFSDGTVMDSTSPFSGSGSGDIESVTAGYGLNGGGTSGAVTLNLSPDTTSYIQNTGTHQTDTQISIDSATINNIYNTGANFTDDGSAPFIKFSTDSRFAPFASLNYDATLSGPAHILDVYNFGSLISGFGFDGSSGNGFVFTDSSGATVHKFYSDGSYGVNGASGWGEQLMIAGNIGFNASASTESYTVDVSTGRVFNFVDATAGNVVITLPDLGTTGFGDTQNAWYKFCKTDSSTHTVTFNAPGTSDTIDPATLSTQYECVEYYGHVAIPSSSAVGVYRKVGDVSTSSGGGTQSKSFTITAVTSDGDFGAIWKAPAAITITRVNVVQVGATNVIGQLQECDSDGASCAAVDSSDITATTGNAADDGTLSNASIDANDWIGWTTTSVSGTNTRVSVTFDYTVD